MASQKLTVNLPDDHIVVHFTTVEDLQQTAERTDQGGPHRAGQRRKRPLHCIPYRFMWDNTAGILKILTSGHDVMTINITRAIDLFCSRMGMDPTAQIAGWMSLPQVSRRRFPGSAKRHGGGCATCREKSGWSSFSAYIARDERWLSRNGSSKSARRYSSISYSHQPGASLQAYAAQTFAISPESVSGAPLVLPFEEPPERPRQGREADIILAEEQLRVCMRWVWQFMD
ncbi:uncharacterized protein P174DRAFT_449293 [Aspergillus novofumigatus IBT 16806]|uniref:Uncharacterized protein n=1 Tax=Aspergillus novofumigatus (strain IBT 16806) TaxID=1392255 RepID=A0A2I1CJA5_ASPN1|nr:uncharacterized protein P174DRAFT_449293 [Aspergillus novofumigatus IBT 16806]PKX97713.1 hypothetical protein P174DRAFT_449293 [Aspergillus novofumigatus IBT 16806]